MCVSADASEFSVKSGHVCSADAEIREGRTPVLGFKHPLECSFGLADAATPSSSKVIRHKRKPAGLGQPLTLIRSASLNFAAFEIASVTE